MPFDDISKITQDAHQKFQEITGRDITLEKFQENCAVNSFPQLWGSTALGFGFSDGQGFTKAQTTVILSPSYNNMISIVYFGGRYAYTVLNYTDAFRDDLQKFKLASVRDASKYGEITR